MLYRLRRKLQKTIPRLNRELVYIYSRKHVDLILPKINVELNLADYNNLADINKVKKQHLPVLEKRLNRGDYCYLTYYEGEAVSYHWVQFSGKHLLQQSGQTYNLSGKEACIYHVRVKDKFHRKGISSFVYSKIIKNCLENEIYNIWIYTNFKNVANRKSLERIGFMKSELIFSIKLGNNYIKLFTKKYD